MMRNVLIGAASISTSDRHPRQYRAFAERRDSTTEDTPNSAATRAPCQSEWSNTHPKRCAQGWSRVFKTTLGFTLHLLQLRPVTFGFRSTQRVSPFWQPAPASPAWLP